MSEFDLPHELAELERQLAAAAGVGPPAALRNRILTSIRQPPEDPVAGATRSMAGWWQFAAAAAAVVLVWGNISLFGAMHTWNLRERAEPRNIALLASRLREQFPELTERQAVSQALLLRAAPLPRVAPVYPSAGAGRSPRDLEREIETWAMP
jgi:hypothetical protein